MDHKFNNRFFELAVDLALIDIKRKYIQKILDLYAKINPDNDYSNVIYTIKFYDGTRERIRTFTKDSWKFYDPNDEPLIIHSSEPSSESDSDNSSTSNTLEKFN